MRTEKDKMLAGELYDPLDPELVRARDRARDLCQDLNATRERDQEARRRILQELFGQGGESVWMQPPFFCDYGSNILLGERVFFNFNCVVLDVCLVKIGDFTLFGPAVQIYTATHPMNAELRRKQEFAKFEFPRIVKDDWPTIFKIKYAMADLLYFQQRWAECGPAFDSVVAEAPFWKRDLAIAIAA